MEMYVFLICILPILFDQLVLLKYSSSCQGLTPPKFIGISIIMKIIWFTLRQSRWLESEPKSESDSWRL